MAKTLATKGVSTSSEDLRGVLSEIQTNLCDMLLNSGALAIGTTKQKILIANTVYAMIDGVLVKKTTAEIAFTATTHDVVAAKFAVFLLSMNASGTVTITKSPDAATLGAVVFPTVPDDEVALGFVIINPTGTGNFDATTTALDDGTVVPNAVYINTPYPFNPNALSL